MNPARILCLIGVLGPAFAGGCLQTNYRPMPDSGGQGAAEGSLFERRVDYRLSEAYFTTAPRCAAIVASTKAPHAISRVVEQAVERNLALRLPRVIGGARLRRAETALGIDMATESGRLVFARRMRCETLLDIRLSRVQDDYMVLWAQRGLTVSLTLSRIADGELLWQARHAADRADGGLPISLIDLPISAARAGIVTKDAEMFASIADDAVRRMMKTLPDVRGASHPWGGR